MTAATSNPRTALERNIDDSIEAALALEQHLQAERLALESRDAEALGIAAGQKQERVKALELLERERSAAVTAGHAAPEPRHWLRFLSIIRRCNDMNTTNGAIIRLRREQVSAALKVVSASPDDAYGHTYGAGGTEAASRSGRSLAAI